MKASGVIEKILPDDDVGIKHQRFIVKLKSGQSVLVIHNINIAARIVGLKKGERISFFGEYQYNNRGGIVHWTHKDPHNHHRNGWLEYKGKIYQ